MQRYAPLIIFIAIGGVGIGAYVLFPKLWDIYGVLDVASAVALSVLAFLGYMEFIRSEDEIEIVFNIEGEHKSTGLSVLRKDCTRSEIMGILGMIQKNPKEKFSISYMKEPKMLKDLYAIQKGSAKRLVIPLTKEEAKQFISYE